MKIWNETLTGIQTRVIGEGGKLEDVWPAQAEWLREHILGATEDIFFNVAANSVGNSEEFREIVTEKNPTYIILDRLDDLATALSALRTEAWVREGRERGEKRNWSIPSGDAVTFKPLIEPDRLEAASKIISSGRENIATIVRDSQPTTIYYEDLTRDMGRVMGQIFDECEIPRYDFEVKTAKFGDSRLPNMVTNPDEIWNKSVEMGLLTDIVPE